jgi:hypothetical protein
MIANRGYFKIRISLNMQDTDFGFLERPLDRISVAAT